jgi:hypothetical protein
MSLIISEVQKNINLLSFEERVELSHWLKESVAVIKGDSEWDAEDTELDLAEKRDAELAIGAKKLVSEEEFWQKIQRFKATLE